MQIIVQGYLTSLLLDIDGLANITRACLHKNLKSLMPKTALTGEHRTRTQEVPSSILTGGNFLCWMFLSTMMAILPSLCNYEKTREHNQIQCWWNQMPSLVGSSYFRQLIWGILFYKFRKYKHLCCRILSQDILCFFMFAYRRIFATCYASALCAFQVLSFRCAFNQ